MSLKSRIERVLVVVAGSALTLHAVEFFHVTAQNYL